MWRKGLLIGLVLSLTIGLAWANNTQAIGEDDTPVGLVKAKLENNQILTRAEKQLAEENGLIETPQSNPVRPSARVTVSYLTESFETWPPTDWTLDPASGTTGAWEQDMGDDHGPGNVVDGTYAAFFNDYDYSSGTVGTITTPAVDLSSATAPRLVFYYWDSGGSDFVDVLVSTDGTVFNSVYNTSTTVSSWTETIVDLSSYAGNSTVYIQFAGSSVWGYDNPHIDLVSVEEAPTDPIISLSVSALDLGSLIPGMSSDAVLTISNTGGAALNISSITSSDAAFTLDVSSGTVAVDGTLDVTVTFSPTASGAYSSDLIITSDAASSPDTVALTGAGAPTSGGPDSGGYAWASSYDAGGPAYSWIDTTGATDAVIAYGDDYRGTISLPFAFRFYGTVYNDITATTNGWIGMGPSTNYSSSYWTNDPIPDSGSPNNIIAPWWDDFKAGDAPGSSSSAHGTILYKTVGTEPNRQFVVIFNEIVRGTYDSDYFTFEVIFDEATSDITFQYADVTGNTSADNGIGGTVGIENADGSDGLEICYNGLPQGVYANEAIHFAAPPAPTDPIIDLSTGANDFGSVYAGGSAAYDVTITNTGGADLVITGVTVAAPFSSSYSGTIAPLASEVATISFNPTVAGDFAETLAFDISGTYTGIDTIALTGSAYDVVVGLSEDFEGTTFPPANWATATTDAGGDGWGIGDGTTHGPGSVHGGVQAAMADIYWMSSGTFADLWTPVVDLTGFAAPQLSFWWQSTTSSSPVPNLTINMSIDGGASWSEIYNQDADGSADSWTNVQIPLTGATATTQFDFMATSDYGSYNLFLDDVVVEEAPAQPSTSLFFSEYEEGSSNNKALEIYNGTNATVNLNEYQIAQSTNGGGWQYYHLFPDTAVLDPGDVWVMVTDTWFPAETAIADEILSYPDLVFFNGDDARGLIHISGTDTTLIDVIGVPTEDPGAGWVVAGIADATKNHTLIRKADVTAGNWGDWATSAGTDAGNSEWVVLDQNVHNFLGAWPVIDLNEPNDILADAVPLMSGDTVLAAVDPAGDVDLYSFTLTEDSQVTIDMLISGYSSLDGKLRLMDSDSGSISYADDGFSGGDEQIVQILGPGTYYVAAGYWGDVARSSTGAYAMAFHSAPYTIQPGEDCEHAIDVTEGTITGTEPPLWYSYTSTVDGSMTITSDINGQSNDTKVYVYDACGGAYIDYDDDGGTGFTSLLNVDITAGATYYIFWSDQWSSDVFDWSLTVQAGQPDFIVSSMTMAGDTLSVEVTNQGTADSPGYFGTDYHGLYIDGGYMGYIAESGLALAAGASYTYQVSGFNWDNLGSGDHEILFVCDVDNDVTEADELNNRDSIMINIPVPPATPRNLIAMAGEGHVDLNWDPTPDEALNPPVVTVALGGVTDEKVKNVQDDPVVTAKWDRIHAEQNATRDARTTGDDCSDPFVVTTLPFNETGSTAGFNNSFAYGNGNDVVYQVTVAEAGYLTASTCAGTTGDTKIQIYAADCTTLLDQNDDFCGLRSQVTVPVTPGDYMVVVDGYSAGDVDYTVDITYDAVLPAPDLTITSMWQDGDGVFAQVTNIGTQDATSESAHWFINGTDVGYLYPAALAPTESDTVGLIGLTYANLGAGDFNIVLEVDYWDYLDESDETNNIDSILIHFDPPTYIPVYNVYRDGFLVADSLEPVGLDFHGAFTDFDMTLDVEHCYTVTQILPDSTESDSSNEACATPWSPIFGDFPFAQDFESFLPGDPFPAGWFDEELGTPDGPNWEIGDSVYFNSNASNLWRPQAHTQYAGIDDDAVNGQNGNEILWTPWFDLTGTTAPRVLFAYTARGGAGSELIVQPMGGEAAHYPLVNNDPTWDGAQFDLTQFVGMSVKIGFHYNDNGGWAYGLGVDDILVDEAPAPGTIAGTVSAVDGNGLGYAVLNFDSDLFHLTTQADANGVYSMDLPAGVYNVHAWALNHAGTDTAGVVVESGVTSTLDFTLNLRLPRPQGLHRAMSEPGSISLAWAPPLPMGQLKWDDGTFEGFWWVNTPSSTTHFFAEHFHSPLPVGYSVNQVAVLATADAPRTNFEKFIVVGPDTNGMPDMSNVIWSTSNIQAAVSPDVRWEVRNVNAVPATNDFWVLVEWPEGNTMGPYVAADEDGTPRNNSFWTSDSGLTWNSIPYNFMIRAFVGETTTDRSVSAVAGNVVNAAKISNHNAFEAKVERQPGTGSMEVPALYDATRDLQSYNVYRTTDPETWGDAYANVAGTLFDDPAFDFDTPYWYAVTAVYDEGESYPSVMPVPVF